MADPTIGGMTLAQWQAELATLTAARDKVLSSQEYQVGDGGSARRNRRASIEHLQAAMAEARGNVERLMQRQGGGARRVYRGVPGC